MQFSFAGSRRKNAERIRSKGSHRAARRGAREVLVRGPQRRDTQARTSKSGTRIRYDSGNGGAHSGERAALGEKPRQRVHQRQREFPIPGSHASERLPSELCAEQTRGPPDATRTLRLKGFAEIVRGRACCLVQKCSERQAALELILYGRLPCMS